MRQRDNPARPALAIPGSVAPTLAALHRHSEADWRRIFATQPELTVAWINLAARSGFKAAQLVLGQMHLDGHGVARNPAAAYAWFEKAAAIGSVEARNMVGRCHELGWGVPVDQAEALRHYRKAAASGLAWGQYNTGCLLLYGTGVRRDHREAVRQFQAAVSQGHAKAMGLLGRCHEEGWGVPVDRGLAASWYARGAEGDDCWSALNLGLMLAEDGAPSAATVWAEQAVATATPNCLAVISKTLMSQFDPELQRIGLEALDIIQPKHSKASRSEAVSTDVIHHPPNHPTKRSRRINIVVSYISGLMLFVIASVAYRWDCLRR
jgi:TPR repeat protein